MELRRMINHRINEIKVYFVAIIFLRLKKEN